MAGLVAVGFLAFGFLGLAGSLSSTTIFFGGAAACACEMAAIWE